MSETPFAPDPLVEDSVARLCSAHVDAAARERVERGEFDAALWQRVVDAGFPLLLAAEAAGGYAQPWSAAYPVLRAIGHWQVPLPLAETMLAALLASLAGLAVPDGPLTLIEQGERNDLALGPGATVDGRADAVPWARHARAALLSLADGRVALLDLRDAERVRVQPHANAAGLPSDTVERRGARPLAVAAHRLPLQRPAWTLGAIARSAMLVGALESALAQSVRYAGERVQFGRPIGRNQAIQHALALMAGDVAAARVAALVAAADAPDAASFACQATAFSAAVAKVRAGEAATRGAAIAHQVHGAIGYTREHPLHHATRRLWAWRDEFGTDAQWAAELGRAAIGARSAGFWPAITDRAFR